MRNRYSCTDVSTSELSSTNDVISACPAAFRACRVRARKVFIAAAVVTLSLLALPQQSVASEVGSFPNRPIKLVVSFPPGGVTDILGRLLASGMTKALGEKVYVDNVPGAAGIIGSETVAKAPPDGYTIMTTSAPEVAVAPLIVPSIPYNTLTDFTPIATVVTTPTVLLVNPSLPVKTLSDLVAYGKAHHKNTLSYGMSGPGSMGQIYGHILQGQMGTTMVGVAYKNPPLSFPDVISGRLSMVFDFVPSAIGFIRSGKLRAIAVMSKARSPLLPNVPTAAQAGFPALDTVVFWVGIEGPAKIPAPIVKKLNAAINTALSSKVIRKKLAGLGAIPFMSSSQKFTAFRHRDILRLRHFVRSMGLIKHH